MTYRDKAGASRRFLTCPVAASEEADLIDLSRAARRAGFKVPVFIARAAWDRVIGPACAESAAEAAWQEQHLHALLCQLHMVMRRMQTESATFSLITSGPQPERHRLKTVFRQDERGETVVAIGLADKAVDSRAGP